MAVYSISTYQACKPELADKTIFGITCKITDQTHSYDENKLFSYLKRDLKLPNTLQVTIQNNQMLEGYCFTEEFNYWSDTDNKLIPGSDLKPPYPFSDRLCYLITAYSFESDDAKAEIKTVDAKYTTTQAYMVSQLDYALDIAHILLRIHFNNAVTITKTTVKNAKYQIDKRLSAPDPLKSGNKILLGHAGDYWTDYRVYYPGKNGLGSCILSSNYTQQQAQQHLNDLKELHPNGKPTVIYGCILFSPDAQEAEYKKASEFMQDLERKDKIEIAEKQGFYQWAIENYQHSQSIRQAIASHTESTT